MYVLGCLHIVTPEIHHSLRMPDMAAHKHAAGAARVEDTTPLRAAPQKARRHT